MKQLCSGPFESLWRTTLWCQNGPLKPKEKCPYICHDHHNFSRGWQKKVVQKPRGNREFISDKFSSQFTLSGWSCWQKKLNLLNLLHSYKPLKAFGLFQKSAKRPLLFSILHHNRLLIGLFWGKRSSALCSRMNILV